MNDAKQWLARLNALDIRDRAWMLEQLPATIKRKLLDAAQPDEPIVRAAEQDASDVAQDSQRALEGAPVERLVKTLSAEPAWLVATVLQIRPWSWQHEVLRQLPGSLRLDIDRHRTLLTDVSVCMQQAVMTAVLAQLQAAPAGSSEPSRFDALLQRLSNSRSRRRWSVAP